jgi:hypothetical protein
MRCSKAVAAYSAGLRLSTPTYYWILPISNDFHTAAACKIGDMAIPKKSLGYISTVIYATDWKSTVRYASLNSVCYDVLIHTEEKTEMSKNWLQYSSSVHKFPSRTLQFLMLLTT